jgi:type IV secretory pathway VirB4 component
MALIARRRQVVGDSGQAGPRRVSRGRSAGADASDGGSAGAGAGESSRGWLASALGLGGPPALRAVRHRGTTRHIVAAYPFQVERGLGASGVYFGNDLLTGGGAFCFDPFQAYTDGIVTSPNMLVAGRMGSGKSSFVKCLAYRSTGLLRSPNGAPRWCVIYDPKGEYEPLAEALGLDRVKLYSGGPDRLNPLDPGPGFSAVNVEALTQCRTKLVTSMLASILRRNLSPIESAPIGWALTDLADSSRLPEPTLPDVSLWLHDPPTEASDRAKVSKPELVEKLAEVRLSLDQLLDGALRGMFDGRSTVRPRWDGGRGMVLDLSSVFHDAEALPLVMLCATNWTTSLFAGGDTGARRLQIVDEAWAVLRDLHSTLSLQAAFKLARHWGVANVAVIHRLGDLGAQSDTGSAASKVAAGLLSDCPTRVVFSQADESVAEAKEALGLTATESSLLPRLARGCALWKIADRTALVQGVLSTTEADLTYTDAAMSI